MTKRTLLTGLLLSGIAFFAVLTVFFVPVSTGATEGWLGKVLLFLFFYVLYMTRFLVLQLKNFERKPTERR